MQGRGALLTVDAVTTDASTGKEIVFNQISLFIRGIGGFGGDRGPAENRKPFLCFLFLLFSSSSFYFFPCLSLILHFILSSFYLSSLELTGLISAIVPPQRAPDAVHQEKTSPQQVYLKTRRKKKR